jgi:hypothetical protein
MDEVTMAYEKTWLYRNAQLEESCPNGCIVVFNPTHSPLLRHQVEALARELSYDYHIYENIRTNQKILEAANAAYLDGYESLLVLTETNIISQTERLVRSYFDFSDVQAFSEVIDAPRIESRMRETYLNALPLREAPIVAPVATPKTPPVATPAPGGQALLLVAALNANPPVKGTGQLIQEILDLQRNAASYVAKYAPTAVWDKRTVYTRIYVRAPEATNSLDAGTRVHLLADGDTFIGLYNAVGASPVKTNPPLTAEVGQLWILGDRRSKPSTKIHEFTDDLGVGTTLVFAPQAQVSNVQSEFGISTVIPLTASVPDEPRGDIIATALALSSEYSTKNLAAKAKEAKPSTPVQPTRGDLFLFQLLHLTMVTGGRPSDTSWSKTDSFSKGSKGYFEGIWAAIPEGDKAFLKEVGEGTGIGDIVSIVNSVRKVSKAALGAGNKEGGDEKLNERWKKLTADLGFGLNEVLNDPRYKQLKSEFDLAD